MTNISQCPVCSSELVGHEIVEDLYDPSTLTGHKQKITTEWKCLVCEFSMDEYYFN